MARIGKIARMPEAVREQLNKRLRDGQLGTEILPWLNALPEAKAVLDEWFQGQAVNAQNLSDWRNGGFVEWEEKQEKTHRIKELAQFAVKLTQANGASIAEGASAIAAGQVLELLEAGLAATEGEEQDVERLSALIGSLTNLRKAEIAQQKNDLLAERLKRIDQEIDLAKQKFEQQLREYQDKVHAQKREIENLVAAAKDGGITPETLQRIEQAASLL
jgi:ATP-dependent Lon protease